MKPASFRLSAILAASMALAAGVVAPQAQATATDINPGPQIRTVAGTLGEGDTTLGQGEFADIYRFQGRRGQSVGFGLVSGDFDAYLVMIGPDDFSAENDDIEAGTTNAYLEVTLPADGQYGVLATSLNGGETGAYELHFLAP